jgi:hypothetical protein
VVHEQDAGAAVASTSGSSPPAAGPAPVYKTVKQLRLRSAAAYLPHPEKESYGGEDAHFVSNVSGGAIGVADGECGCVAGRLYVCSSNSVPKMPEGSSCWEAEAGSTGGLGISAAAALTLPCCAVLCAVLSSPRRCGRLGGVGCESCRVLPHADACRVCLYRGSRRAGSVVPGQLAVQPLRLTQQVSVSCAAFWRAFRGQVVGMWMQQPAR